MSAVYYKAMHTRCKSTLVIVLLQDLWVSTDCLIDIFLTRQLDHQFWNHLLIYLSAHLCGNVAAVQIGEDAAKSVFSFLACRLFEFIGS